MVEVAGEPVLTHCFDQLIELGADEVVVVVRDRFSVFVIDTDLKIWLPRQSLIHNSVATVNGPIFNDDGCTHDIKLVVKGRYFFPVSHDEGSSRLGECCCGGVDVLDVGDGSRMFSIVTGS
jgi:hypothetical protein